jgi:hypothetical protein
MAHATKLNSRGKVFQKSTAIAKDNILLLLLHIKFRLIKNFVKAMNKQGNDFECLRSKFSKLSNAKLIEGIFMGIQIRETIEDDVLENLLKETEKSAWLTFSAFCLKFFGNVKADNHKERVDDYGV